MIRIRQLRNGAISTLTACILILVTGSMFSLAQAEAFRPEIANPLQAAQALAKNKKFPEALAKVREADAVSGKTAAETAAIEQMRGYIATTSGDTASAINSYETQIQSGRLGGAEQLKAIQALTSLYYQARNYDKAMLWAQRYIKEGGTDPQIRGLPMQLAYLNGDCQTVIKQVQGDIRAAESAGHPPSDDQLQLLANCASKQKDNVTYLNTMEKLVTYYPKKEYWADVLSKLERKPGFSSTRLSIDIYRLKLLTGNLNTAADYMEMAQLALQDNQTAEAKKVVDQGFSLGLLGSGPDTNRHNRLRALVEKRVADQKTNAAQIEADAIADPDASNLLKLGHNYINAGEVEKGVSLMEQAMKKDLKRPDIQKLKMGIGYLTAGQRAKGVAILKTVGGTDGAAELARLWIVVKPIAGTEIKPSDKADKKDRKKG